MYIKTSLTIKQILSIFYITSKIKFFYDNKNGQVFRDTVPLTYLALCSTSRN